MHDSFTTVGGKSNDCENIKLCIMLFPQPLDENPTVVEESYRAFLIFLNVSRCDLLFSKSGKSFK